MSEFIKEKVKVDINDDVGVKGPIDGRKYTLTHSDITGELFLTIGTKYDYSKITEMRDELLANLTQYELQVILHVDGNDGITESIVRDKIFRRELPLALKAVVYGDRLFFELNRSLYELPVSVKFESKFPEYNVIENWGIIGDYLVKADRFDNVSIKEEFYPPIFPKPIYNYKKHVQPIKNMINNEVVNHALIIMLEPYIRSEIYMVFGYNTQYCLKRAEILSSKIVNSYSPCTDEYEIIIGMKVGKVLPIYNNIIITFLINQDIVKIMSVKNPRNLEEATLEI